MKRRIELELTDREINQLRELMDSLPLATYAPLVVTVLKALPITPEHSYLLALEPAGHPTPWDDVPGERDPYLAGDSREIPNESATRADTAATGAPARAHLPRGGGFSIRAISERGRQAMPALESRLLAAGIPWTREEV